MKNKRNFQNLEIGRSLCTFTKKIPLAMRLFIFYLFCSIGMLQAAGSYAQNARLSLNVEEETVANILHQIEEASDFDFFYNNSHVDLDRRVSVSAQDSDIFTILDEVFEGTGVHYTVLDKKIILSTELEASTQGAQQQRNVVKGKVVDSKGEPVIGATIKEVGTDNGTVTDIDGNFTIHTQANATLEVSFIGYQSQTLKAVTGRDLAITLAEDMEVLDEVVVVGYGSVKKRDLTGSVSQVNSSTISNQAVMKDPLQALQGKIAGADITMGNAPGSSSTIVIRGYNSLNAGNEPLIVVDDAPFGGNIDEINPAEIETIDVLKDASSTAIYGSRGANGVIIITTKRARKDSHLSVNYDGYFGISKSFKNYDMMSGEKYADWKRMANYGKTDGEIFDDIQMGVLESGEFVDWQDLMFSGTGYKTDHNVTINQSNGRNRNMVVLGYNKDQSIIDNMGYERFSARINGDMELTKNLKVGYSSLLALTTRRKGEETVWKYGTVLDPLTQVYDENGDPYELHHIGQWTDSPLAELTWAQHREGENFSILHNLDDYSDIDRSAFAKEKSAHWMARYDILNE